MLLLSFVAVFSVGIFSTGEAARSCAWSKFPDQQIVGGELQESAKTLKACQTVCEQRADCVSLDFAKRSKACHLSKTQEGKTTAKGVDHYDRGCVDVVSPEVNLALGRPATQSSTRSDSDNGDLDAGRAVDGNNKDITEAPLSCSHTNDETGGPNWWRVQLDRPYRVGKVTVTNRGDRGNSDETARLDYFIVGVTNSAADPVRDGYPLCGQYPSTVAAGATVTLNCDPNIGAGQYVIIQQPINGGGYFTLCEVEVYARKNPCDLKPCENGGTCFESGSDYECSCPLGYSGENCETPACPDGFDFAAEINQCLYLNMEQMTWDNARNACARMKAGAQMVLIKDSAKQEAVKRYLEKQFAKQESAVCVYSQWVAGGKIAWLGGQTEDPNKCGTPYFWKPVGRTATSFCYTNWTPGYPNCAGRPENCAITVSAAGYNYRWEDIECNVLLCSVCEI